ncbi:MAG: nuclease-related domain-containing protein [Chthoniobacteraceae bacterium]
MNASIASGSSGEKGAVGEAIISGILETLPENYFVVHDFSNRLGNIDHVVIGPTGIFVIDTKNWKGVIESESGELKYNGNSPTKPLIGKMTGAIMTFREKLNVLVDRECYVNGIIVFTAAYLRIGDTGAIRCLTR